MIKPVGMQLMRIKGYRLQAESLAINGLAAKKVDRTTDFGNPIKVVDCMGGAPEAVARFKEYCPPDSPLAEAARRILRGHNLACFCRVGFACHRDYLLEIAND
jgi:hypothetical protein